MVKVELIINVSEGNDEVVMNAHSIGPPVHREIVLASVIKDGLDAIIKAFATGAGVKTLVRTDEEGGGEDECEGHNLN